MYRLKEQNELRLEVKTASDAYTSWMKCLSTDGSFSWWAVYRRAEKKKRNTKKKQKALSGGLSLSQNTLVVVFFFFKELSQILSGRFVKSAATSSSAGKAQLSHNLLLTWGELLGRHCCDREHEVVSWGKAVSGVQVQPAPLVGQSPESLLSEWGVYLSRNVPGGETRRRQSSCVEVLTQIWGMKICRLGLMNTCKNESN